MVEHELDKPSFVTAMVLLGAWAVGVLVMQVVPPIFWLGVAICFGAALGTIWRYGRSIVRRFKGDSVSGIPLWEAIVVSILVPAELIGAVYLTAPVAKYDITQALNSKPSAAPPVASPLDNTMQLTCGIVIPTAITVGSPYVELRAIEEKGKYIFSTGMATSLNESFGESPLPYKCQLQNFKQEAAINIVIVMQFVLRKFSTVDFGFASAKDVPAAHALALGALVRQGYVNTPYQNIGPNSSFTFFVRNFATDVALEVILPTVVMGEAIGQANWGRIKLIPSPANGFVLGPWKPSGKVFAYYDTLSPVPKKKPSVASLPKEAPIAPSVTVSSQNSVRDPDMIYQLGEPVASVEGMHPHLDQGTIEFEVIRDNGTFNVMAKCEYRDYVLRVA
jgi:hypothetical protein